jgi:hypothetical protein
MSGILPEKLDDCTYVIYLEVDGSKVVNLQAYLELYEGIGIVRTLDIRRSLVCVLTTPSMLEHCVAVLEHIRDQVPWQPVPKPTDLDAERFLGYFRKEQHA